MLVNITSFLIQRLVLAEISTLHEHYIVYHCPSEVSFHDIRILSNVTFIQN